MPFKLLKKTRRQYKVVSKSLFVMSVELLDGVVVECTLGADSSGQDCLDNVCQRLVIDQSELFGLRYTSRAQQPRWVQLDRPLKRQLDKYAASPQLYLRVMYYVISGTALITDEVTRYHYFLQLKNDLLEGRIACDCQQAVVLASYSRQAEYGNLDRERHTVEYLKNVLQFPKQMVDGGQLVELGAPGEGGRLEWLTAAVIQHQLTLHNMSQAQAEEGYISACQVLSGYGQETVAARDTTRGADAVLAVSLTGVVVARANHNQLYRWTDITNVINHKRTFSIECAGGADSASFVLPTPEDGKYIWRMCVLQHTFYMKHQSALQPGAAVPAQEHHTKFQEHGLSESREELDAGARAGECSLGPAQRAHSTSCLELVSEHAPARAHAHLRALLPTYRAAPDYETAIQHKHRERAQAAVHYGSHLVAPPKPLLYGSHPDIHRPVHYPDVTRHTVSLNRPHDDYYVQQLLNNSYSPFPVNHSVQNDLNLRYVQVYKPPPPYPSGMASNSTPDLAVASQALRPRGYIDPHVSGSSPDLVSRRQYLGHLHVHPHGTYSNLNSVLGVPNPHVVLDHQRVSNNVQRVYDERGNVMYSVASHRAPYQRHIVVPQHSKMADAHEPIYENVPLPWKNEPERTMRDRAQSLTERDEGYLKAKFRDRNSSHPSIAQAGAWGSHPPQTSVPPPTIRVNSCEDSHYVNAKIIQGVRNSSVPKDLNMTAKCVNNNEPDLTASVERLLLGNDTGDETPYQSLLANNTSVTSNHVDKDEDNVTSIAITGSSLNLSGGISNPAFGGDSQNSSSSGVETATNSSAISTQFTNSLDLESTVSTTKSGSVTSKEKKRRRWGMFIGKNSKTVDVKSATLGRDKKALPPSATKHRWSTGLPKMQPLPPSITKETLCQLLERKMSDDQLTFEFERIAKGRDTADFTTALLPENACHNGLSADSLPYEDNRVKLDPSPGNKYGYINASHITMTVGNSQRFYVVGRCPQKQRTTSASAAECALYWQCVWQVGARVTVLVSGDSKPLYLPERGLTEHYGKISVRTEWQQPSPFGVTSRARLRRADRQRTVWHVQYALWTDGLTLPSPRTFLAFLLEVDGLRSACAAEPQPPHNGNAPVLVTCPHGAGRSGVALAADVLLHSLDHNQELESSRTLKLLHRQRANMVQNVQQYRFLHAVLLQYLQQSRLI